MSDRKLPGGGERSRSPILQALYLIALQPTVFSPPAVIRNFRHAFRPDRFRHGFALRIQHVNLTKLRRFIAKGINAKEHVSSSK
jgi:hypothetical protein